jgi:hypothetical protein
MFQMLGLFAEIERSMIRGAGGVRHGARQEHRHEERPDDGALALAGA